MSLISIIDESVTETVPLKSNQFLLLPNRVCWIRRQQEINESKKFSGYYTFGMWMTSTSKPFWAVYSASQISGLSSVCYKFTRCTSHICLLLNASTGE